MLSRAVHGAAASGCSSLSSSSAPISEHSRLHKLTPLWTILRTHPRCVKTKVMGPKVELYCTEPCPPWSTCRASTIRWRTSDGCSKNARVVLWWVGSRKMSEQTNCRLFAITEVTGGWPDLCLTSSLVICAVYGICSIGHLIVLDTHSNYLFIYLFNAQLDTMQVKNIKQ